MVPLSLMLSGIFPINSIKGSFSLETLQEIRIVGS